jgi:murein DD-endopeptidase MepM/ murein hydrolase activator NlpD
MKYLKQTLLLAALTTGFATVADAQSPEISWQPQVLQQGQLVRGAGASGCQLHLDDQSLQVDAEGRFVFGFGRDYKSTAVLTAACPEQALQVWKLDIASREYQIQRIDGLPPSKVTPNAEQLKRIRKEGAAAKAARKHRDLRDDVFADFIWPATGPISGVYGSQRILNGNPRRPHFGVDIARPTGTPTVAPAAGIVRLVHEDMYFSGGTVIIDHGHGVTSAFLHLSKIHVEEGQRVEQGQLVADIGATGRVTGPHLDWRMNWRGERVDPVLLVPPMPAQ